ncbi:hypothetical protein RJ639_028009 [Escallonia herrerae]|uniref:Uncharacterized protein n=1 Tax=Escallonia herrerae TaxID=1293975 RepID=A0AA88X714_9ASTE|nr:hypothetical protein RJ639_028009 [Escallonia herrerae]
MVWFATHLYNNGYSRDANFLPGNNFEVTCFENSYGRDLLKHATEKFGKDHQEIAKWLSGGDLKTMAVFGCPSLSRKKCLVQCQAVDGGDGKEVGRWESRGRKNLSCREEDQR